MSRYTEAIVGGMWDGKFLPINKRMAFVWIESDPQGKLMPFVGPGPRRQLHRRARWREGMLGEPTVRTRSGYVFAGFTHRQCPGCNSFVERVEDQETCPLCGEVMSPNAEV